METSEHGRALYVIATTPDGTAVALKEAARLADRARIVLLVPVPMTDHPMTREYAALIETYAAVARRVEVQTTPYACVCRHPQDVAVWFEVGRATIVVGGERGPWPLQSPEEQLVRALRREGHFVRFVGLDPHETHGAAHDVA